MVVVVVGSGHHGGLLLTRGVGGGVIEFGMGSVALDEDVNDGCRSNGGLLWVWLSGYGFILTWAVYSLECEQRECKTGVSRGLSSLASLSVIPIQFARTDEGLAWLVSGEV